MINTVNAMLRNYSRRALLPGRQLGIGEISVARQNDRSLLQFRVSRHDVVQIYNIRLVTLLVPLKSSVSLAIILSIVMKHDPSVSFEIHRMGMIVIRV